MAKRSALEVLDHYHQGLIFSLPMKDIHFIEELFKHELLPEDIKHKLEELPERKERTSYFLDDVIKAGLIVGDRTCFIDLLTVMNNSKYDNVKDLAKQIQSEYDVDAQCKLYNLMIYIRTYIATIFSCEICSW